MRWIALQWLPEPAAPGADPALPPPEALGWWALQFTPRVVWLEEALLLEVSACERLWGGLRGLGVEMRRQQPAPGVRLLAALGDNSLAALARLRLRRSRQSAPPQDQALPLSSLSAARPHLDMLERLGCQRWGDVHRLPRAGLSRRFGPELRRALDQALGRLPEVYRWLELPESFDQKLELPALAERAAELLWSASRLLGLLQLWLRARQRGVLGLELEWRHDLRRIDGVELPPAGQLLLRTAEPVQDMDHLKRLLSERLALQKMLAPANALRLRTLETAPWGGLDRSFLPEDNRKGDALHQLVERLSARLGDACVLAAVPAADHRPEAMQRWLPARSRLRALAAPQAAARTRGTLLQPDALYPGWLLDAPQPLALQQGMPHWRGELRLIAGPQRLEAGWWISPDGSAPRRTVRDYFIAQSPAEGLLLWIFREMPPPAPVPTCDGGAMAQAPAPHRHAETISPAPAWFLHGLYA